MSMRLPRTDLFSRNEPRKGRAELERCKEFGHSSLAYDEDDRETLSFVKRVRIDIILIGIFNADNKNILFGA